MGLFTASTKTRSNRLESIETDATKLLKHFMDLHQERHRILERLKSTPLKSLPSKDQTSLYRDLKRNVTRDGTILKLVERDLDSVLKDVKHFRTTIEKAGTLATDQSHSLHHLEEACALMRKHLRLFRDKQADYLRHKDDLALLLEAVASYHAEERKAFLEIVDAINPDRLTHAKEFYLRAKNALDNGQYMIAGGAMGGAVGTALGVINMVAGGAEQHPVGGAGPSLGDKAEASLILLGISLACGILLGLALAFKEVSFYDQAKGTEDTAAAIRETLKK